MNLKVERVFRVVLGVLLSLAIVWGISLNAGQKKDKKKKPDASATKNAAPVLLGDEQQIDYVISTMLGAWQIGDLERLRQSYADDVTIVNGSWAPPIIGWSNYATIYQQQHARMQQIRMDRSNTYVKLAGSVAWAFYQWDFGAVVDGQQSAAQGHTTLILQKQNNRWVIVHNHTSFAQPTPKPASPLPGNTAPVSRPPAQPN
jgi:ketosteroid isomerase-like protein